MAREYSKTTTDNVRRVMKKRKKGTLKSGSGKTVTSRKQAVAIALSESRRAGGKVPKTATRKSATRKTATKKAAKKKATKTAPTRKKTATKKTSATKKKTAKRKTAQR